MKFEFDTDSDRYHTCSFTGYRPSKLAFNFNRKDEAYCRLYNVLKKEIMLLAKNEIKYFQTGMALGIDLMCGEIVLELKKDFDIHLFCIIPCKNQRQGWSDDNIALYNNLINNSSGIIYTSTEDYSKGCMMKRNKYLVDTAEHILAVYDGKKGGTMSTIEYAKKNKRTITIINPINYTKIELIHGSDEGAYYV